MNSGHNSMKGDNQKDHLNNSAKNNNSKNRQ